ncbi:MAG: hypothetical protein KGH65_05035 [Candidatus Micrarchaeota archaeon]|nr:hypothetical protein [Candidatus Micrarchaeota archaeon]
MVKVYKSKEKLVIYLPFDVIETLSLKENDEVDFFRFKENSFIFAKKSDITELIVGKAPKEMAAPKPIIYPAINATGEISRDEIDVLKKLDTLKYNTRSKENVLKILDKEERILLKGLMKKKAVSLFAKESGKEPLFSITKGIYDRFLMRKNAQQVAATPKPSEVKIEAPKFRPSAASASQADENQNVAKLEKEGFIVLQSEPEASSLSLALEGSIRRGQVLGTRSFNKKFYIILRTFFDRHGPKILKALKDGGMRVSQIASEIEVDEDGVRAILYLLAESGDVSEKRKDFFTLA